MENFEKETNAGKKIIAIGGGKGGVGKSVISASLGAGLAKLKRSTVVVDGDLGGSNLHTIYGNEQPAYTLMDFIKSSSAEKALVQPYEDIENLRVLFGASGSYGISNLNFKQKEKLIRKLQAVDTDFLILDLGAGTSYNVLDLFLTADHGIVLVNPDPLSILEGFNFIKQAFYRGLIRSLHKHSGALDIIRKNAKLETFRDQLTAAQLLDKLDKTDAEAALLTRRQIKNFRPMLLINKYNNTQDETAGLAVKVAAEELLFIDVEYLGHVHYDDAVPLSLESGRPFILFDPKCKASRDIAQITIIRILNRGKIKGLLDQEALRKTRKDLYERHENATVCSFRCLYWEECAYREGGLPCKMQHLTSIGGFQGGKG